MNKKIYIIPGFGETTSDPAYKEIIQRVKKKGYTVIPFTPQWRYRTLSHWASAFSKIVEKQGFENALVLGFSFGAMIALISAQKYQFKKLILCSPSPYFREDIPKLPKAAKEWIGKRRIADFKQHPFIPLNTPALFIMGADDWTFGLQRLKERAQAWLGRKELIILKDVDHYIGYQKYIDTIIESLPKK